MKSAQTMTPLDVPVWRADLGTGLKAKVHAKIGLLPTGHKYYWEQFPGLFERGMNMYAKLRSMITPYGDVVAPDVVDCEFKAREAGDLFRREHVDLVVIFPLGYTPSMNMIPAVKDLDAPIRILNAHEDRSYDYAGADTSTYLHHEGVCCIPEFAGSLVNLGRKFEVRTGAFGDSRLCQELEADFHGAAAAAFVKNMTVGLIGQVYTHMGDMPIDEHRLLRSTGRMLARPEVEEIENAYHRVTREQLDEMRR